MRRVHPPPTFLYRHHRFLQPPAPQIVLRLLHLLHLTSLSGHPTCQGYAKRILESRLLIIHCWRYARAVHFYISHPRHPRSPSPPPPNPTRLRTLPQSQIARTHRWRLFAPLRSFTHVCGHACCYSFVSLARQNRGTTPNHSRVLSS